MSARRRTSSTTPAPADHDRAMLIASRALADPTRHAIFVYIRDAPVPVGVAELTRHIGCNHNAVRQHLSKLLEADLVVAEQHPPVGPGRPPWRYRVSPGAAERWGGPSAYAALSSMLLEIVTSGAAPVEVGRAAGRRLAEQHDPSSGTVDTLCAVARRLGFEPHLATTRSTVDVVLERCPFVEQATMAPGVVCELHRGIAEGIAERSADHARVVDLVVRPPEWAGCQIRVASSA
jgi:predicted ArsR family transcriptional regulator